MFRFRAFLLWAVMLALPFQGYAAASMLYCATGQPAAAASAAGSAHDHAAHSHHGDVPTVQKDTAAKASTAEPASPHKCSTCGTCGACHAIALTDTSAPAAFDGLPQAELAEPFKAIATLAPRVPDKPPRA